MNDSNQYMVQVGDYDQNTYIIQDANGVQYEGGTIISGELPDGTNLVTEPRWIQGSGRGGKVVGGGQSYMNGDIVSVSGTGLNLNTRFTPSSIVLNTTAGNQFDQDSLRIASAVSGSGARGRPRGRKPSRGNFPVVPIDMVRQLGIEQQVILQPTVPVAVKNKCTLCKPISHAKKTQFSDSDYHAVGVNTGPITDNIKIVHKPVFIPIPVPVYIPVPVFMREKKEITEVVVSEETAEIVTMQENEHKVPSIETIDTQSVGIEMPNIVQADAIVEESINVDESVVAPVEATLSENVLSTAVAVEQISKKRKNSDCEDAEGVKQRKVEVLQSPEKRETDQYKLKYTFGMNAWRHWNKSSDLLKLSVEEMNSKMSDFVQQVKKPNNEPYVPDSIMYLCLGIQLYLIENGRKINLFIDPEFFQFQIEINKILATFKPIMSDNQTLVCRIEEDHLWDSQQLGLSSSGVLLFSVCYLITFALKVSSPERLAAFKFSDIEITDSEVFFVSDEEPAGKYPICHRVHSKRPYYEIVKLYFDRCNSFENRPDNLFLKPRTTPEVEFEPEPVEPLKLEMMYNRMRIVREVQENLISSGV